MSGYGQTVFANGIAPPINAANLNKTEAGVNAALGYDSLQEVRDLGVPENSVETVYARGHTVCHDGGAGTFHWLANSTIGDDNGVVLLPTGHSGSGRWVRAVYDHLTPEMFGAVGDGATNDSVAVRAWADGAVYGALLGSSGKHYRCDNVILPAVDGLTIDSNGATFSPATLACNWVIGTNDPVYPHPKNVNIVRLDIDGMTDTLGVGTGGGIGCKLNGYTDLKIGSITAKNCWGHGLNFLRFDTAKIGSLTAIDNLRYGIALDAPATAISHHVQIDSIEVHGNGHRSDIDGTYWAGVSFDDTQADSGWSSIQIGSLNGTSNGRHCLGLGRNANSGEGDTSGPIGIQIANMVADYNRLSGTEIYGAKDVQIASLRSNYNGAHGVYVRPGDDEVLQPTNIAIGSIEASYNDYHGVYIVSPDGFFTDDVHCKNNGLGGSGNDRSNFRVYSASGFNHELARNIRVGKLLCENTAGGGDEPAGQVQHGLYIDGNRYDEDSALVFVDAEASGSEQFDFSWTRYPTMRFGDLRVATYSGRYTDDFREQLIWVRNKQWSSRVTSDDVETSVLRVDLPSQSECLVTIEVLGRSTTTSDRAALKSTTGVVVITGDSVARDTTATYEQFIGGCSARLVGGGAGHEYATVLVTGIAGQTMHWDATAEVAVTQF